ncbi:hypothetical protein AMS58_20390 [Pseudoalteromonas porphyrae]|uniref:Uncharacterized protein n=2 Tax=Pseudoalteromonas TaxID=53246 RepID=A0A0N1EJM2_9GAMM|nr:MULTISPECIES: hypothetical protein [Pseudoalteromonas]KPH56747.1 hypothetical protein ADS77_20420 [Pseudoalteromonas porphyrae]KPH92869.1 hypothetical protein AMS58_20390 [Pseudoalteromonas porphyrae]NMR27835.1 hypothetical protein [Pseudoalteromonas sp. NEC-BIFX-2020_015]NNG45379.1 hypothetical protein [Pseudoalteromonas sp. NEC-BIFX-2020_002]
MKKFLVLVVVILALFTIDHPMIKEPREKLLGEGVGVLSDAGNINRGRGASMAKSRISSALTLSGSEREYLEDTLKTDEQLQLFHTRYCNSKDLNLYFYEDRLATVCSIVSESLIENRAK